MTPILPIEPPDSAFREGFFRYSASNYHAIRAVSQSMLKLMHGNTPAHLKWKMDHPGTKTTDAQKIGTALHSLVFDGIRDYVAKPEGMEYRSKENKAWRDSQTKPILDADEIADLDGMSASIADHEKASSFLACEGISEVSAFCLHRETGILRKARPDRVICDDNGDLWILDLKSCRFSETGPDDASEEGFSRAASKYGYHWQAPFYMDIMADLGHPVVGFIFIVVEKEAPWCVNLHSIAETDIDIGRELWRNEIVRYAECEKSAHWPAYGNHVNIVKLKPWADGMKALV